MDTVLYVNYFSIKLEEKIGVIIPDMLYLPYSINIKYLLSTNYVLGTIRGSLNKSVNKAYKYSCLLRA